jgi:hypothetical protein
MLLKTFRRLRHLVDLPEQSLEEVQARHRVEDGRLASARRWHECPHCRVLISGAHKCEEKPEPAGKARRWRVA